MSRILVALDESPTSHGAARVAAALFADPHGDRDGDGDGDGRPDASNEVLAVNVAQDIVPWVAPELGFGGIAPLGDPAVDLRTGMSDEDVRDAAEAVGLRPDVVLDEVGIPAERILAAAEERDVDVVVVGAHHRGFFERLMSGSVSKDVLRRADRPVLVVPDGAVVPSPDAGVLVAVEGEEDGERVATVAARLFGGRRRISLLHVVSAAPLNDDAIWTASVRAATHPGTEQATAGLEPSLGTRLADNAHELLQRVRERVQSERRDDATLAGRGEPAEIDLVVDVGDPEHTIEDRAEALDAAVIVVGASPHGWFSRLFGSGVPEGLVAAGSRSVLVV